MQELEYAFLLCILFVFSPTHRLKISVLFQVENSFTRLLSGTLFVSISL